LYSRTVIIEPRQLAVANGFRAEWRFPMLRVVNIVGVAVYCGLSWIAILMSIFDTINPDEYNAVGRINKTQRLMSVVRWGHYMGPASGDSTCDLERGLVLPSLQTQTP
jgi:hypothetical protein